MSASPTTDPISKEREVFGQFITERGLKLTRQREAILDTFMSTDSHIEIEDLYQRVKKLNPGIGHATVYRTMKLLLEAGLAQEHQFRDGVTRYERTSRKMHHDHLICLGCGKIIEFTDEEIERLQEQVAQRLGFQIVDHKLELYGRCGTCQQSQDS